MFAPIFLECPAQLATSNNLCAGYMAMIGLLRVEPRRLRFAFGTVSGVRRSGDPARFRRRGGGNAPGWSRLEMDGGSTSSTSGGELEEAPGVPCPVLRSQALITSRFIAIYFSILALMRGLRRGGLPLSMPDGRGGMTLLGRGGGGMVGARHG